MSVFNMFFCTPSGGVGVAVNLRFVSGTVDKDFLLVKNPDRLIEKHRREVLIGRRGGWV